MPRLAIAFALAAGALLLTPKPASALPLALGDHAALSQALGGAVVEKAARRSVNVRRNGRYAAGPRRYHWTYYPYWRPYQYRYWQFYYPYGGPLF
jgi:hypothetical protein